MVFNSGFKGLINIGALFGGDGW